MKLLTILIAWTLIVSPLSGLYAQTPTQFQTDILKFGRGTSAVPKQLIFDTGDAGLNKMLSLDNITKQFSMNSTLNVTGAINATGNISSSAGNISASGSVSAASADISGTSRHQSGLTMGTGANASKQITVDRAGADSFLKWNEATGKWVFSNDGTVEKNFGSGSGGETGMQVLLNPSWEDGAGVDWTSSGGTYSTIAYGNPPLDDQIYASFIATTSGQFVESVAKAIPTPLVGGCLAKINYFTTDSASWKIQILDGSSNLLGERNLDAKNWQDGFTSAPCPTSGTFKLRVISTAAGTILMDRAYLGKENRTFQVAQAALVAKVVYATNASCAVTRSAAGMGAFGTSAGCLAPSVSYYNQSGFSIATTDQDTPARITFTKIPAGTLEVRMHGSIDQGGAVSSRLNFLLTDGTTSSEVFGTYSGTAGGQVLPIVNYKASYPTGASNVTIELHGQYVSGSSVLLTNTPSPIEYEIYYWPSGSQTALVPEAQDWLIDANIGGANPSLGTAAQTSYVDIADAALDMVLRPNSAAAEIGCNLTNPPTGLFCGAGNENISVAWTPPAVGWYDVCFYFGHQMSLGSSASVDATFQVVETALNSQTIVAEGGQRTQSRNNSASTGTNGNTIVSCGSFQVTSISKKIHRLMYEQATTATISTNTITADRSASLGQRDIRVTVRPSLTQSGRPYLTGDQVTTKGVVNPIFRSAKISSAGVITDESGEWLGTCTIANPVSTCTMTGWSAAPTCTFSLQDESLGNNMAKTGASTSSQLRYVTQLTLSNTHSPQPVTVNCHGF